MNFSLNKNSLVLHIGLAMASIVLLAIVGMSSSVFMTETSKGYAAAINQAGTLRMQSYRIAASLVQTDEALLPEAARRTQQLADEFENRLLNERIHNVLSKGASEQVMDAYDDVERQWNQVMKPLLQEYLGSALALKNPQYPSAQVDDLRRVYLGRVDSFVDAIHRLVRELEDEAEGKIDRLQMIQLVVLLLTVLVVMVVLRLMTRQVVSPLSELLEFARQVSRGDFSRRNRPARNNELGQLGSAFDLMAEELEKMYRDLEQRVRDKTFDLERSNRSLELLYATTKQLNERPLDQASLQDLVSTMERVLGVSGGAVCLGEIGDDEAYRLATTLGKDDKDGCEGYECMQCFGSGMAQTIHVDDLRLKGSRRYSVPIHDQAQQFGVLVLDVPEGVELEDWQRRLLDTVASHIALSIARARQISQKRLLSLMEERSVIARELHDSLAQSLSYLKIQVSLLENSLQQHADPKVGDTITKLRDGLNSAYRELRELLTTFRLRINEDSVGQALQDTILEFSERGNIDISLNNNMGDRIFSANQEIHLVQIVREALSNVIRHANARQARVSVNGNKAGEVEIVIEDDGVGMPDIQQLEHHYGMAIMRERTQGLGGSLHVGSSELGGTAVKLFFHVTPAAHG